MIVGNDPGQQRPQGGSASARARLSRLLSDEIRHEVDLARLGPVSASRWSDALLAELRFQLAGVMNAVEVAIGLHIADPAVERAITALGPGYCRLAIERETGLLSPELLAHLRRRAAVAMLVRRRNGHAAEVLPPAIDGPQADLLAALSIAERRWSGPMLLDLPMRPDLPAEYFHDLAWTVAALLIQGCERQALMPGHALIKIVAQATEKLIARHDEGQGAFALAQRCARSLPAEYRPQLAPAAMTEGRLLLFAALVASETGLGIEAVVDAMIDGQDADRQAVLRLMEVDDATAFQVAGLLAPLNGSAIEGDAALVRFVEEYRRIDRAAAERWLAVRASPHVLAEKLALMERP